MNDRVGEWPHEAIRQLEEDAAVAVTLPERPNVPLFEVEVVRRHRWRQWEVWLSVGSRRWLLHRAWLQRRAIGAAALETDFALQSLRSRGLL